MLLNDIMIQWPILLQTGDIWTWTFFLLELNFMIFSGQLNLMPTRTTTLSGLYFSIKVTVPISNFVNCVYLNNIRSLIKFKPVYPASRLPIKSKPVFLFNLPQQKPCLILPYYYKNISLFLVEPSYLFYTKLSIL